MRIAVDGRVLMKEPTGVANFLISALNEYSRQKPDWEFIVLISRNIHESCQERIQNGGNIRFVCKSFTKIGMLWYCTQLPFILYRLKPDYFWAPATYLPPMLPRTTKTIVTVHDLVPREYRQTMSFINRIFSTIFFDWSVSSANMLWAVSKYTMGEIERYYPNRISRNILVGSGVENSIFKPIEISVEGRQSLLAHYGIKDKFILFVGTVEPRKNLEFMLSLMPRLAKDGFYLLIVGARGWGNSAIQLDEIMSQKRFPREKIVFTGFVNNDQLVALYNMAAAFVLTSLNEGFGLPLLEAMHCGCPVVAAHNSAMIELVEGAGLTVDSWEITAWCDAIRAVSENKEIFQAHGFVRSAQYAWDVVINRVVAGML